MSRPAGVVDRARSQTSAKGEAVEACSNAQPLRVLHVVSGNLYGGVEKILVTLAKLRDMCPAMEPHFAVCYEARLSQELRATGAPVHAMGSVRVRKPWTVLRARRRMRELLRSQRFDAVICHMTWAQAIFGPVVRASHASLIFYLHNRMNGRHWSDRWARIAAVPDLALCVSHDTSRTLGNIYPGVKSEVIYSPLPGDRSQDYHKERAEVRRALRTEEDSTVIIQVSRMEAWKGHVSLLEALGKLRQREDWTCWIVGGSQTAGEAEYAQSLKDLADRLGIAHRVRFLGERSDVPRLMAAADLFCQPNRSSEGFSIVFMEAFLAGLPIVTTAIGGALELVNESCGVLLPQNDLDALVSALSDLLNDPNRRRALGRTGQSRVNDMCKPETQLGKLKDLLRTVVDRR